MIQIQHSSLEEELENQLERFFSDIDQRRSTVIDAMKNQTVIHYGSNNQYTINPLVSADIDVSDSFAKRMLIAYINKNDAELLELAKELCDLPINEIADLIGR